MRRKSSGSDGRGSNMSFEGEIERLVTKTEKDEELGAVARARDLLRDLRRLRQWEAAFKERAHHVAALDLAIEKVQPYTIAKADRGVGVR